MKNATTRAPHPILASAFALTALTGAVFLSGCAANARVAAAPARPATVVVAPPPAPPAIVEQPAYVPQQNDAYVSVVLDRDVVYVGGYTYLWIADADGHRHRHLYGRGDLRGEVLHRRAELRTVMARNDGHLPMQHARMTPPGPRVHVTMQAHGTPPHGARAQQAAHEVHAAHAAHETHAAREVHAARDAHDGARRGGPAPMRVASANVHRHPESHPRSHPAVPGSPRFAGSPPHAG